ncbi:restriction endonuclease [Streptomyces sp. MP131-18]|uniref:restriction endonuclease n=1 Tax=Streptomyces sp. MP131-18 TaxID=1857892 RepID=UPI00097BC1EC|nr:restriction endonuclease [Streptomyces sp. MP131-18]ONK09292.1 Restriction endonuclease [Streptomyces sp. MP131-18]
MARRKSRAARRRRLQRQVVGVAVGVVAVVVAWSWVWPYLLVLAVLAGLGGLGWWGLRVHRGLRERDRLWREEDRLLEVNRSMSQIDGMDPDDFEHMVAALLRRDGCTEVQKVGRTNDGGRDVIGFLPDGRSMVVQCKRFAPDRTVGDKDMRDLLGTRTNFRADVAVLVTNTRFSRNALTTAARNAIVLVHRDLLDSWRKGSTFDAVIAAAGGGQGNRQHLKRWQQTYTPPHRTPRRRRKRSLPS